MSYIYLLAGENLELARAEVQGFLESQQIDERPAWNGRAGFTDAEPSRLKRLALVQEVSEVIERGEIDQLEPDYRPEGSFAVRAVDVNGEGYDTKDFEEESGSILENSHNSVELENPGEELRLYLMEDEYVLSRLVVDIDRGIFEKRKNQERPFSSPVSLDPVLARVLVNLSGVSGGGNVIDPMCGTGGILIEAGLCGIGVHGLDVQQKMVEGARENLEEYGIIVHDIEKGEVKNAGEIFDREFDAVITDLPYGKASKKTDNAVEEFLETAPELTDGTIVFMSDREKINDLEPEFEIYVHKNLTRYIYRP